MNEPSASRSASEWEAAYLRFETPSQELRKFRRRLLKFGAGTWPKDLRILELFCGRGNGLRAWSSLGFSNLEGADLSRQLASLIDAAFHPTVADARDLPFADASFDVICIQGGLHHLEHLPRDLPAVLQQCRRVLKPDGRLLLVEPWETPFLKLVHFCCRRPVLRNLSQRLDALATMIELEADTYFNWLSRPEEVRRVLLEHFDSEQLHIAWGKLHFLGRPKR